jgi:hypothetical protein
MAPVKPTDIRCIVCRELEPPKSGMQVGVWTGIFIQPCYHICKRCVEAGRQARRDAELAKL